MTTVNYPTPVTVNGYSCKNCTDVDYAKKHIDPAHPKDGPYGVDAKDHTSSTPAPKSAVASDAAPANRPSAVQFGGALAGVSAASGAAQQPGAAQGRLLDISA
ncbi:hypothetical protein [Phenylobacterium sp.]|jgi:hypothetical protein|uniref:hypothetical protein n=1 Tax=Phenylobacterium sp. TaxID=1871053 RepID=UPI002E36D118|nr:hypothetical protein [Phenylobacterium sp.]HEX3366862.1 hypothetical protein [Phenylobacterium sp.]